MSQTTRPTLWVGPIAFAAVLVTIAGLFNVLTGLTAVFDDKLYVGGDDLVVVFDVTTWGWVHTLVGAAMFAAGLGLLVGQFWAQLTVIALVSVSLVTQMIMLPAYPLWSLTVIAIEVVVLWAIMAHGDEVKG